MHASDFHKILITNANSNNRRPCATFLDTVTSRKWLEILTSFWDDTLKINFLWFLLLYCYKYTGHLWNRFFLFEGEKSNFYSITATIQKNNINWFFTSVSGKFKNEMIVNNTDNNYKSHRNLKTPWLCLYLSFVRGN